MTLTRLHAAFLTCLLVLPAVSAGTMAAQATSSPTPAQVQEEPGRPTHRARPVFRLAQDYTLGPDDVAWHVQTVFSDTTIEGRVRDVIVILGSARLASTAVVEGELVVVGGSAVIEEGASVGGDLVVLGGTVTAPPGFHPGGEHVVIGSAWLANALRDLLPWVTRGLLWGRLIVPDLQWVWPIVAIFFLMYLALNTVFERPVGAAADAIVERPISIFLVGLLVLLLTLPALAIVAASVIGLALVPFLLCAVIVLALVGKTAIARALGRGVIRSETDGRFQAFAAFVIGFILLTLAYMVPVLGFVTWALTTVLGLGAATATFHSYLRRERHVARPAPAVAPVAPASALPAGPLVDEGTADASPSTVDAPPPPPPPPAYTAGLAQYPRASFFDRVAAFALDAVLVAIANALLDLSRNEGAYFLLLLAYHVAFWAWKGTTLGGIVCNLRVVRTHGTELRFVDALVRGLSSVFSIVALGIGCLWMLQDAERQMWHDKIAGTLVVKVPRDLVLP